MVQELIGPGLSPSQSKLVMTQESTQEVMPLSDTVRLFMPSIGVVTLVKYLESIEELWVKYSYFSFTCVSWRGVSFC